MFFTWQKIYNFYVFNWLVLSIFIYPILFLFIYLYILNYFLIVIHYKSEGIKRILPQCFEAYASTLWGLHLNASPCLTDTKMLHLTLLPLKTLVSSDRIMIFWSFWKDFTCHYQIKYLLANGKSSCAPWFD